MDHAYFRDRVSAFHDRELPLQELAIVEEHIRGCVECQKLLADLEKLDAAVAARMELAQTDYWEDLAHRTEERLGFIEKTEVTPVRRGWDSGLAWKITAIAASLAILVFIGINKDDIIKQDEIVTPPGVREPALPQLPDTTAVMFDLPEQKDEGGGQRRPEETSPAPTPSEVGSARRQVPETVQFQADREQLRSGTAQTESAADQPVTPASQTQTSPGASNLQETSRVAPESRQDERAQPLPVEPRITKEQLQPLPDTYAPQTAEPEQASKTKAVRKKTTGAAEQVQEAPQVTDKNMTAETDADVEAAENELQSWRAERDSLTSELKARKLDMVERFGISSFRSTKSGVRKLQSAAGIEKQQAATEQAYLEASYHVARLTDDRREYQDARASLEEAASRGSSANARLARQFLSQLDRDRSDRPGK